MPVVPVMPTLLSLVAAACFGVASVLQHIAARRESPELSMRAGLLISLARRPGWLLGNLLDAFGVVCQFVALERASVALVNPLLVCSLLFALPLAALSARRRILAGEYLSAAAVAAGLAMFMVLERAGPGRPYAGALAWAITSCVLAALVGLAVALARGPLSGRSPVLLATGAGFAWGYASVVTELAAHLLRHGVLSTLSSWAPYMMIASGAVGMLLAQSAFQAGELATSLPVLTVIEPLVAIAISKALFGEGIDLHPYALAGELAGLAVMSTGVFALARREVPEEGALEGA